MQVYSVQVLDEYDKGYLGDIVEGIYWAIENNMDIINLSFGTTYNAEILHQAIRDAKNAGIFFVAAAGNSGGTKAMYPAAFDEVIAVGSSTMEGEIASGSVHGNEVDIYAPGKDILVDSPFAGL